MSDDEKKVLCLMIMRDLRGNWSGNPVFRAVKVYQLAKEIGWEKTMKLADEFINDPADGRHFRCDFNEWGGYENSLLQECSRDFWSYSIEFQKQAMAYLTYPVFDNWACS